MKEGFDYVQTWLLREDRLCAHCPQNEVETDLPFLTSCQMYDHVRNNYFPLITQTHKEFENKSNFNKLPSIGRNNTVCNHSSTICDLLPKENGNQ
jgi:hypothetical protein